MYCYPNLANLDMYFQPDFAGYKPSPAKENNADSDVGKINYNAHT